MFTIFCPHCDTLLLDAPRCPHCGEWERPRPVAAEPGSALAWKQTLPARLGSSLTLGEGSLFACDDKGQLHALDAATGTPRWPAPVDLGSWRVYRQVAVGAGLVIVGPGDRATIPAADKAVLALDAATGEERWRRPLETREVSDPLVADDTVYVATSDGYAVALALGDGTVRWRVPITGICHAAPALAGSLVVFGSDRGSLIALRTEGGERAWPPFQAQDGGQWGNNFPYSAVYAGGVIYATCWNRRCYAVDAATGEQVWPSEPTKRPPMTPPLVASDAVYFCAHDRYVYCLDRPTGQKRWKTQLPRRSQTTPVLAGDFLYVASQDHNVYALDPATGEIAGEPVLETVRRVEADWATDGQQIFLGDCDGHVYAIAMVEPDRERDPQVLIEAGKWRAAAVAYALAGDLTHAAELYRDKLEEPGHAAQLYEAAGELAPAAELYAQAGQWTAARRLCRKLGRNLVAAQFSDRLSDVLAAAQDYEAAGAWSMAAARYQQLDETHWARAAALFEQAAEKALEEGDEPDARAHREQAAALYEKINQPEKAIKLYQEAGRQDLAEQVIGGLPDAKLRLVFKRALYGSLDLAHRLAAEERHVPAAGEFLRAGRPREAAQQYAAAAEYALAAENYAAAEDWADAGRMMEKVHNWREAARFYERAGNPDEAARCRASGGAHAETARFYEGKGNWPAAAEQWTAAEQWKRAAHAWQQAGALERAAAAWQQAGAYLRSGEAFWQAAQEAEGLSDEAVATLYDRALAMFVNCGADQRAQECDARRRYWRKQPLLQITVERTGEFALGGSGRLDLRIQNVGWGIASGIKFDVAGQFEADLQRAGKIPGLAPGYAKLTSVYIIPLRSGRELPLYLTISYHDSVGHSLPSLERTIDITVSEQPERRSVSTPQVIVQEGGQYIQAKSIHNVAGEDLVNIERHTQSPATSGDIPAAASPGGKPASLPVEARMITCPNCGQEQTADHFKCVRCGLPFVRCASCGLYQPQRADYCPHCGAPQTGM